MTPFLFPRQQFDRRLSLANLAIAFAIATFFYKFGSFALECLAFLATWAVLDLPSQWLARRIAGRPEASPPLQD